MGEELSIERAKELLNHFKEIDENCSWAISQRPQSEALIRESFYRKKLDLWEQEGLSGLLYIINESQEETSILGSSFVKGMQAKTQLGWEFLHIFPSHGVFDTFRVLAMRRADYSLTFMNEDQFWAEIAKRPFPNEFLDEQIKRVEGLVSNVTEWLLIPKNASYRRESVSVGDYQNYCFAKGYDFFARGEEIDWREIARVFYNVELYGSLEDYGNCFCSLYDGSITGSYRLLLLQQKKRLERGEEIARPNVTIPTYTLTEQRLTHAQISLLYIYTQKLINKNNAKEIAEQYGQTSGDKLFREYQRLSQYQNERISSKNAVKNIQTVIGKISDPIHLSRANDELILAKKTKGID